MFFKKDNDKGSKSKRESAFIQSKRFPIDKVLEFAFSTDFDFFKEREQVIDPRQDLMNREDSTKPSGLRLLDSLEAQTPANEEEAEAEAAPQSVDINFNLSNQPESMSSSTDIYRPEMSHPEASAMQMAEAAEASPAANTPTSRPKAPSADGKKKESLLNAFYPKKSRQKGGQKSVEPQPVNEEVPQLIDAPIDQTPDLAMAEAPPETVSLDAPTPVDWESLEPLMVEPEERSDTPPAQAEEEPPADISEALLAFALPELSDPDESPNTALLEIDSDLPEGVLDATPEESQTEAQPSLTEAAAQLEETVVVDTHPEAVLSFESMLDVDEALAAEESIPKPDPRLSMTEEAFLQLDVESTEIALPAASDEAKQDETSDDLDGIDFSALLDPEKPEEEQPDFDLSPEQPASAELEDAPIEEMDEETSAWVAAEFTESEKTTDLMEFDLPSDIEPDHAPDSPTAESDSLAPIQSEEEETLPDWMQSATERDPMSFEEDETPHSPHPAVQDEEGEKLDWSSYQQSDQASASADVSDEQYSTFTTPATPHDDMAHPPEDQQEQKSLMGIFGKKSGKKGKEKKEKTEKPQKTEPVGLPSQSKPKAGILNLFGKKKKPTSRLDDLLAPQESAYSGLLDGLDKPKTPIAPTEEVAPDPSHWNSPPAANEADDMPLRYADDEPVRPQETISPVLEEPAGIDYSLLMQPPPEAETPVLEEPEEVTLAPGFLSDVPEVEEEDWIQPAAGTELHEEAAEKEEEQEHAPLHFELEEEAEDLPLELPDSFDLIEETESEEPISAEMPAPLELEEEIEEQEPLSLSEEEEEEPAPVASLIAESPAELDFAVMMTSENPEPPPHNYIELMPHIDAPQSGPVTEPEEEAISPVMDLPPIAAESRPLEPDYIPGSQPSLPDFTPMQPLQEHQPEPVYQAPPEPMRPIYAQGRPEEDDIVVTPSFRKPSGSEEAFESFLRSVLDTARKENEFLNPSTPMQAASEFMPSFPSLGSGDSEGMPSFETSPFESTSDEPVSFGPPSAPIETVVAAHSEAKPVRTVQIPLGPLPGESGIVKHQKPIIKAEPPKSPEDGPPKPPEKDSKVVPFPMHRIESPVEAPPHEIQWDEEVGSLLGGTEDAEVPVTAAEQWTPATDSTVVTIEPEELDSLSEEVAETFTMPEGGLSFEDALGDLNFDLDVNPEISEEAPPSAYEPAPGRADAEPDFETIAARSESQMLHYDMDELPQMIRPDLTPMAPVTIDGIDILGQLQLGNLWHLMLIHHEGVFALMADNGDDAVMLKSFEDNPFEAGYDIFAIMDEAVSGHKIIYTIQAGKRWQGIVTIEYDEIKLTAELGE